VWYGIFLHLPLSAPISRVCMVFDIGRLSPEYEEVRFLVPEGGRNRDLSTLDIFLRVRGREMKYGVLPAFLSSTLRL